MSKKLFLLLIFLTSCSEKVDLIVYNATIYAVDDTMAKHTSVANNKLNAKKTTMTMPNKIIFKLTDLHMLIVKFSNNFRSPLFIK